MISFAFYPFSFPEMSRFYHFVSIRAASQLFCFCVFVCMTKKKIILKKTGISSIFKVIICVLQAFSFYIKKIKDLFLISEKKRFLVRDTDEACELSKSLNVKKKG
jgi:amino acid permease